MKYTLLVVAALVALSSQLARVADAPQTWAKTCSKCHGHNGNGDTKMGKKLDIKDLTDAKTQASLTDDQIFGTIKNGVKKDGHTRMKPAENLTDADIKALVGYVRGLKK